MQVSKKIFISYSTYDKEKVRKIKKDIQASGHEVWIYPEAIDVGEDILVMEREGIRKSDFVLIMVSKKSLSSEAVKKEIDFSKTEERKTGKRKLILVNIEKDLPINNDSIQRCDLSSAELYAVEFNRLIRKIETHKNFELTYSIKDDSDADNWFEVRVWVEGKNLNKIKRVDYYVHRKIAEDSNTESIKKKLGIVFYTPHNEHVYATVYLRDGTVEELSKEVWTT